jgi:Xaa-Pro aminopeptidase
MAFIFKTPLEKNMVIDTEPKFIFAEGVVGIENTFVVRVQVESVAGIEIKSITFQWYYKPTDNGPPKLGGPVCLS